MPKKLVRSLDWPALAKVLYSALGPKEGKIYLTRIQHWMRFKGLEWTTTRLKLLWNLALLYRSGDIQQIPGLCQSGYIAISEGLPKGIEGILIRRFGEIRKPSALRKLTTVFRCYTGMYLPKDSVLQVAKAKKSINTEEKLDGGFISHLAYRSLPTGERSKWHECYVLPFYRRSPIGGRLQLAKLQRLSGTSSYPHLLRIPSKDIKERPYLSMIASLATKGRVPSVLTEYFGDFNCRQSAVVNQDLAMDPYWGKIVMIQEGGAKGRTICSPNAWVQFYTYPFHVYLLNVIKDIEKGMPGTYGCSCVLDQLRGVYLTLNRLNSGSYCWCVDLSSATDRFPLGLQKAVCEDLGIPEFGEALEALKGPYLGIDGEPWYYNQGQPMGLYGSFPLFHLSHFALLQSCAKEAGLSTTGDHFAVLGDDVVIFNEKLHQIYLNRLKTYKVPISGHKCFRGDVVEFAGFILTNSGTNQGYTAFRPYKFGRDCSFSTPLNVLHSLGAVTGDWDSYWKKAYKAYSETQGMRSLDLTPLLHEDVPAQVRADSLPGSRWLGSMLNLASYYNSRLPEWSFTWDSFIESWADERDSLLHQQEAYVGEFERNPQHDASRFDPELYAVEENTRKSFFHGFFKDPLIKTWAGRVNEN